MSARQLDEKSYKQFRTFLEQQCGIVLGENKQYLVKSRLAPLMAKFNIDSHLMSILNYNGKNRTTEQ